MSENFSLIKLGFEKLIVFQFCIPNEKSFNITESLNGASKIKTL